MKKLFILCQIFVRKWRIDGSGQQNSAIEKNQDSTTDDVDTVGRNLITCLLIESMNEISDVMGMITEIDPHFERGTEANRGIHDKISSYKEVLE